MAAVTGMAAVLGVLAGAVPTSTHAQGASADAPASSDDPSRHLWTARRPADDEHPPGFEPQPPPVEHAWYGGQTLVTDVLSVSLVLTVGSHGSPELALVGLAGYALAPAVIHGIHGNTRLAVGSGLYRTTGALLTLGGFANLLSECGESEDPAIDCDTAWVMMLIGGAMTLSAPVLDAVLAWEVKQRADDGLVLAPVITPDRAGLQLRGRF